MSSIKVVKAVNMKSSSVNFSDNVRTNKYSGKSVYMNYNGGPLRIQMPKTGLPFGIGMYLDEATDKIKYSLELSLKDVDKKIIKELEIIEERVLVYVEKISKELFKKQMSKEFLQENYKSSIRYSEVDGVVDERYAPRLKTKIYTDGKTLKVDAYDSKKVDGKYNKIVLDEDNVKDIISKGSSCEAILSCSGIWVVGKTFGVSWVLSQVKVYKNENSLSGYAFDDDDEEEESNDYEQDEGESNDYEQNEDEPSINEHVDEDVKITAPAKKARRKREDF
jgi:hypothetical protein